MPGLTELADGNFLGATYGGGANGAGAIFEITPSGKLTVLHSFDYSDGDHPDGRLLQGRDGNFYGTTFQGGANNEGTVFKITPQGVLTTLHNFNGSDGGNPYAGLIQASDGNFYGTAAGLGGGAQGTIFRITQAGAFAVLHNFHGTDTASPVGALLQAADGNLYGATTAGGAISGGTIFEITLQGKLTTLYNFCSLPGCGDGSYSESALIQATDGNFYGTTFEGGANSEGTVFQLTPTGVLTTLQSLGGSDGDGAAGGVLQATNGTFYGTTDGGPIGFYGTVFSLSMGFGPFVQTLPGFGRIGTTIKVLGNNLTGATSVTFNGTAATFTVAKSGTYISTCVPAGATTGPVQVVTPSGTLTSNVNFQVLP